MDTSGYTKLRNEHDKAIDKLQAIREMHSNPDFDVCKGNTWPCQTFLMTLDESERKLLREVVEWIKADDIIYNLDF